MRQLLRVERLERRDTPSVFGQPWADPRHLTLSLAPDGTPIGTESSSLFATLSRAMSAAVWEEDIFRAVQAWATVANVNVGVVGDGGQAFGTAGLGQSDARFGDIRIGARPMARSVLAVTVPPDAYLAGTWAGDITLNSSADWSDPRNDLYAVMLHEVGHALGLGESDDPTSVMFRIPSVSPAGLSAGDVAAVRGLYGPRLADPNETPVGNDTAATATAVPAGSGRTPLVAFGDITTATDIDVFSVSVPATLSGPMTVDVLTRGVSLLAPRVSVYDSTGVLLATLDGPATGGDRVTITVPQVQPGGRYFIRVEAAGGAFAVGRYGVGVTFPAKNQVSDAALLAVLAGPNDIQTEEKGNLFGSQQGSSEAASQRHSTLATAIELNTTPGFASLTHFTAVGSLSGDADGTVYTFETPERAGGGDLVLTAAVSTAMTSGAIPALALYRANGQPVAVDVLAWDAGRLTIQAVGLVRGEAYYLKVFAPTPGADTFRLVIDFAQPAGLLPTVAAGSVGPSAGVGGKLYVALPQLFHLSLTTDPSPSQPGAAVLVSIRDATGGVVWSLTVPAGQTASTSGLLLPPGEYLVDIAAVGATGPLSFRLRCGVLGDPVGPVVDDPTATPAYRTPATPGSYTYPNGIVSLIPFLWTLWVV